MKVCPRCGQRHIATINWDRANKKLESLITTARERIMSWSASVSSVRAVDAVAKLRENFTTGAAIRAPEVLEQFEAATRVVETVLLTVQPEMTGLVNVSASGHANPGHKKTDGWSNDCLSLSVTQV